MSELIAFWVGHSTYEEKLMELLPATTSCQAHIKGHRAAHEGLLRGLKKLAVQVNESSPQAGSNLLWKILESWLGDHARHFDADLARHLDNVPAPEIDFDAELVAMLDKHVFTSRPTKTKSATENEHSLKRKRLEIRGRFESLSPAQKKVFWQAIEGKKNSDIANLLSVSINTIKSHRAAVFRKMEVGSVLELVKIADVLR
jgi:DNA-binding CsgD family transcriptional regulator